VNYFVIAMAKTWMESLDGHVRNRLRMCKWKQWKVTKARRANLLKLGASSRDAYEHGGSSAGYSRVARSYILCKTLTVAYFRKQGYVGFSECYAERTDKQTSLF
jgi:RNA-directed DNA polymerase